MTPRWSLVEVPRYLFYLVKELGWKMPTWLLFLRYNMFYVLYPLGMFEEIMVIIQALPFIKATQPFSISLPNPYNMVFNFYYASIMFLPLYIPRKHARILPTSGTDALQEYDSPEREERSDSAQRNI